MKYYFYIAVSVVSYNAVAQTSAYSQPQRNNEYISTVNTQLISEVLTTKQAQYNRQQRTVHKQNNRESIYLQRAVQVSEKVSTINKLLERLYNKYGKTAIHEKYKFIEGYGDYVRTINESTLYNDKEYSETMNALRLTEELLIDIL